MAPMSSVALKGSDDGGCLAGSGMVVIKLVVLAVSAFAASLASAEAPSPRAAGALVAGREALEQWYLSEGQKPTSSSGQAVRALAQLSSPHSLFVTEIGAGPQGRVRGFRIRPGRAALLRPVLARLGVEVRAFATELDGPCDRFEISVQASRGYTAPKTVSTEAVLALVSQDDSLCRTDRAFESQTVTPLVRRGSSDSGITLRLRDVDLTMILQALRAFTQAAFIVDGDVSGRFDVEWTRVTLGEAIDSLQSLPGLHVKGPEPETAMEDTPSPRFRVSSSGRPWSRLRVEGQAAGPVAVEGRREVSVFLSLISDLTGITFALPEEPLGEATVLGADLDPAEILANLLDSAGLAPSWDDPYHARLSRDPARVARAPLATPRHPTAIGLRLRAGEEDYARCRCLRATNAGLDLELAGVGRLDGPWRALLFSAEGVELPRRDPLLLDYRVAAVDADGMTLKLKNGARLRSPLAPLRSPGTAAPAAP